MPRFVEVLDGILGQRCSHPFEVFCIDTDSSDGTWEEIGRRGLRRRRIRRSEFDHGRTRNEAIATVDGDLIALTVQDATPKDDRWLEALVDAVLSRADAAGAYSRQLPYPDANPFVRRRLENWSAGRTERVVQRLEPGTTLADLAPLERLARCAFDNVSSILRRSTWERFPIPTRRFGEDVAWGKCVVEAGHAIVFEPSSTVIHSHQVTALDEFRRIYQDHANLNELFGVTTVQSGRRALRNSLAQCGVYRRLIDELGLPDGARERMKWYSRGIAFAETFGQWLGARSVRKGTGGPFAWVERFARG